jgi:oligoendopeptidase F
MTEGPRKRQEVPEEDRWDLTDLYDSDREWEKDLEASEGFAAEIQRWKGRLGESPRALRAALEKMLEHSRQLEKLVVYAHLRQDEDLSVSRYGEMFARATSRATDYASARAFFEPELLEIPEDTMQEWLQTGQLAPYRAWLEERLRYRPHTLSRSEERLMAMSADFARGFSTAFGKLANVDMPDRLPRIEKADGEEVQLTNSNLVPLQQEDERETRHRAFAGYYGELSGNLNTYAALLDGQVRQHIFEARARDYPSCLEASLFRDRVGVEVYEKLIGAVHDNLDALHGYYALKSEVLDLEGLEFWDVYYPVVKSPTRTWSFDDAVELTLEAVSPLGPEYVETLRKGFRNRWVDRYENRGKRSGAYSSGCYDSRPYILHNFSGTLDSVFTLAHEAGHSMHSWHSKQSQPYHYADYRILVAEVASITNEMLLLEHLVEGADREMRAYLLDHLVNSFRTTLFRQTMFAEFEKLVHEHVESGGALNRDYLNETYMELVRRFHGDSFSYRGDGAAIACEWARVPHFYYDFYVYKYATGMASAMSIADRILRGDEGAVESYLEFLRGGCSRPPLELLRSAGVDLTTSRPVEAAMGRLRTTLDSLGELIG